MLHPCSFAISSPIEFQSGLLSRALIIFTFCRPPPVMFANMRRVNQRALRRRNLDLEQTERWFLCTEKLRAFFLRKLISFVRALRPIFVSPEKFYRSVYFMFHFNQRRNPTKSIAGPLSQRRTRQTQSPVLSATNNQGARSADRRFMQISRIPISSFPMERNFDKKI